MSDEFELGELTPEDITESDAPARDAADILGVGIASTDDEVESVYRALAAEWHPDAGGDKDTFVAIKKSRDILKEFASEEAAEERGDVSSGTGSFHDVSDEQQEVYQETIETVKLFMVEEILGKDLQADSMEEAVSTGEVTPQDFSKVSGRLDQAYGVDISLDRFAEIVASLIVQGAINLGSVDNMMGDGIFKRRGATSKDEGIFGGRSRRRSDSIFR